MPSKQELATSLRAVAIIGVVAAAVFASHVHGVPATLPGVALDWRLLFHVERAGALLGAVGTVFVVGWRASQGELPVRFGQLEYAQRASSATAGMAERHEHRIRILEVLSGIRDPDDIP